MTPVHNGAHTLGVPEQALVPVASKASTPRLGSGVAEGADEHQPIGDGWRRLHHRGGTGPEWGAGLGCARTVGGVVCIECIESVILRPDIDDAVARGRRRVHLATGLTVKCRASLKRFLGLIVLSGVEWGWFGPNPNIVQLPPVAQKVIPIAANRMAGRRPITVATPPRIRDSSRPRRRGRYNQGWWPSTGGRPALEVDGPTWSPFAVPGRPQLDRAFATPWFETT